MDQTKAVLGGVIAITAIFAGLMVVRILTWMVAVTMWIVEILGMLVIACLVGFIIYRILLGESDDPRSGINQ